MKTTTVIINEQLEEADASRVCDNPSFTFSEKVQPLPAPIYLRPESETFPFPTLRVDPRALLTIHKTLIGEVGYWLGAKCAVDQTPKAIDCSGYVGWLLCGAASPTLRNVLARDVIGRGTFHLAEWLIRCRFKKSHIDAGRLKDGALRCAVTLAARNPLTGHMGIGHIALIQNGRTLESHGGVGVNSREWTGSGWQSRCTLYVLTAPSA